MRVFVTLVRQVLSVLLLFRNLLGAGHQELGLARSDAGAESLFSLAGAPGASEAIWKTSRSLRTGAAASDGVIHAAFIHDFSEFGG